MHFYCADNITQILFGVWISFEKISWKGEWKKLGERKFKKDCVGFAKEFFFLCLLNILDR